MDYNGAQYWSGVINVIAGEQTALDLPVEQLGLNPTKNPRPTRFDGAPPVPEREEKRLAGLEGLVGIISRAGVGYTSNPKVYYYLNDQLGTPQVMVDSMETVVWEARYKPFGEAQVHPSLTVVNNFRFPGQYYDNETGLHYNYFRDYYPAIGRYVEPDPIALEGGVNLYAYVQNRSLDWTDPEGLFGLFGPGFTNVLPDNPNRTTGENLFDAFSFAGIHEIPGEKRVAGRAIPGQFGTIGLYGGARACEFVWAEARPFAQFMRPGPMKFLIPGGILRPQPAEAAPVK